MVQVYDAVTHALKFTISPYDPHFTGGVRVAVGDVNGDGVPDVITAPGPGGGPDVRVYDGTTGALLRQFFSFDPDFTGGLYVAAGDVNGDGFADLVCGAGAGGGPNVTTFSGKDGTVLNSFFPYDPRFTGGVFVTAADVDGDGRADIAVGAGAGGGPNVAVLRATDLAVLSDFMAAAADFTGGVQVAVAKTADGKSALIAVPGVGGGAVRAFDPLSQVPIDSFFAQSQQLLGGIYVAASAS